MPIYRVKVRGGQQVGTRIVRASSAARARDHVVDAAAINAEELADAIGAGAVIEDATEGAPDPAGDPPAGDPPPSPNPDASKAK